MDNPSYLMLCFTMFPNAETHIYWPNTATTWFGYPKFSVALPTGIVFVARCARARRAVHTDCLKSSVKL